jgi:transglutaminase-like putative cysteine protease
VFDIAYAVKDIAIEQKSKSASAKTKAQNPSTINHEQSDIKPEDKFQKTIEDIETLIEGAQKAGSAEEQRSNKGNIRNKKAVIETLDVEIKKQLKDTEQKIKDLPEVIKQRHRDFVKHYDNNLRELKANLDEIDKAKTATEKEQAHRKAKDFLEKTRPPKKHRPLDPNKLPHRVPEVKEYEVLEKQLKQKPTLREAWQQAGKPVQVAAIGSLAGLLTASATSGTTRQTPPTASDLAETVEAQLTTEISAKALELENNPVKIYEWVRNSIDYEPYHGSLKGAQQTLAELAGNDMDQSSLLIALLRAANIPARYVSGTIELPIERLMNWIGGIKDPMTAARILATNGIPGTLLTEGGQIKYAQFEHAWVEAYVDMFPSMGAIQRQASYWTPLDPSLKETESSDSINISKTIPFDEATYLNSGDDMPPVLSYIYKLKDYYNTNYDYNFMKIFHVSVKKRQEFGILMGTLPYEVITEQRYSELPDIKRHKISLSLSSSGIYDTGETFSVSKPLPEIAGKKVTISYAAATSSDQAVITRYGGLLNTPAYLVNVKPEVKLDDAVILTGPVMGLGASLSATTTLISPNMSTYIKTTDLSHGISYAVGISALTYPGTQLISQIDRMRVIEGSLHDSINAMDARAGELLQNIAVEYFGQLNNTSRSIEGIMHVQNTKMPSIAFVSADAHYGYLYNIPVTPPIMDGLGIDAIRVASSPMPIDGDLNQRREFVKHRGLTSSYLEHKILENLLAIESISAVKALQIAAKNGIPLYTANKTNIDSILPILTISARDKTDIQNAVNGGKEVTVSRDNITLGDWTGVGYIARDPNTGAGVYMISNDLGGGGTVKASNPKFDRLVKIAWFITGQIDNKDNKYLWMGLQDITVLAAALPIWQRYGYIPAVVLDAGKEWIKLAANYDQTWIFYYAGHGWYIEDPANPPAYDFLSPAGGSVRPNDIDSKAKIVFLNSCGSMHYASFESSFHIDGTYTIGTDEISRSEAIIGFAATSWLFFAEEFAFEFWLLMGTGLSVQEARAALYARAILFPDISTRYHLPQLRVESYGSATLVP